jgi:AraC-like DNA-binding protein
MSEMRLYSWGARALYLGPALSLTPHRNAVAVLALGLDAPFGVANDPQQPGAGYRRCRSVFIPPNTLHHLADTRGRMAFLYVDARSHDRDKLCGLAAVRTARAAFDLSIEADLIDALRRLSNGEASWKETRETLAAHLSGPAARIIDPRIRDALARLHAAPASRIALADLAPGVRLSESRLLHLFKQAVGVPFRRYKLWIAMGAAMRTLAAGENLTAAALDAGFASSAHFSATFREMFGLEPSRLSRGRLEQTAPA